MTLKTFGAMGTDLAERVNFDRLRTQRLGKAKAALKESELGEVLCFDMNNIRYLTATAIGLGPWTSWCASVCWPKMMTRSCGTLVPRRDITNSIARGWGGSVRVTASPLCAEPRHRRQAELKDVAQKIKIELEERGLRTSLWGWTSRSLR